jgi:hypothetical protein
MAQVVERLLCKCKILRSNLSAFKKKNKEKKNPVFQKTEQAATAQGNLKCCLGRGKSNNIAKLKNKRELLIENL